MNVKWSQGLRWEIIEYRRVHDVTCKELSARFGPSATSIAEWLREDAPDIQRPKGPRRITEDERIQRFWSRVIKSPERDGCWLFTGGIANLYGVVNIDDDNVSAHVFSYELAYGPITDGLWVLHKCDVMRCHATRSPVSRNLSG